MSYEHISGNLADVRRSMEAACREAGRSVDEVTLVAVSKTFPLGALAAAGSAGQVHFGENKVQELSEKCAAWDYASPVTWHMIGHLQRNKAKEVARHADVFHALDSLKLALALDRKCQEASRTLSCFVQVNVSGEPSKFGVHPDALYSLLDQLSGLDALRIEGLMTLAAAARDAEEVRPQFRLLRDLATGYAPGGGSRIHLHGLSMGMSGDYRVAIQEGATHVRVGSAIFGRRSYL
jgi:PLP dependent protein